MKIKKPESIEMTSHAKCVSQVNSSTSERDRSETDHDLRKYAILKLKL